MKDFSTMFQICIYITIVTVIFTVSISFVAGLNIFPTVAQGGVIIDDDAGQTFEDITTLTDGKGNYGTNALWNIVAGSILGLAGGIVLGYAFQSTALLGISVFSGIFWSAYISAFAAVTSWGYFEGLEGFILIGSVGMLFVFAGAVAGMLSGSG